MPQVYTVNGYSFVASPARYGHITRQGPVSGITWVVTPIGVWIDEEDAEILTEIEEEVWCFRTRSFINRHMVFYAVPTRDQYDKFTRESIK